MTDQDAHFMKENIRLKSENYELQKVLKNLRRKINEALKCEDEK